MFFLITKQNNSCPGGSPACQGRRAVAQTSPEPKEEHFHTWLPAWHSGFAAPAHSPVPSRVPARGDPYASPWSLLSRPAHRSFPRSTRNSASSLSLNAQPCHSKQALLFISCLGFKTLCFSADHFPPVNMLISGHHSLLAFNIFKYRMCPFHHHICTQEPRWSLFCPSGAALLL